jgi:hypothetical protein
MSCWEGTQWKGFDFVDMKDFFKAVDVVDIVDVDVGGFSSCWWGQSHRVESCNCHD